MEAEALIEIQKSFKKSLLNKNHLFSFPANATVDFLSRLIMLLRLNKLELLFYLKHKNYIPAEIRESLSKDYRIEAGIQAFHLSEMAIIMDKLKGIELVFLKGVSLSHILHFGLHKRSGDIDFLISKKDVKQTISILSGIGYTKVPTHSNGEFSMKSPSGILVDIHYNITASSPFIFLSRINIDTLLKTREYILIDHLNVPVMNREYTLIHLCVHFGVNHMFNEFILLFEIREFIRLNENTLNWEFIINYCISHNLNMILYINLRLLHLFGMENLLVKMEKLMTDKAQQKKADLFMEEHLLAENILTGKNNGLNVMDIPSLCSDSILKKIRLQLGCISWSLRLYEDKSWTK